MAQLTLAAKNTTRLLQVKLDSQVTESLEGNMYRRH